MNRSKAFSKHQEERKQELLKKHGCYILKNIKGDITVNDPSNYSIEYKNMNNILTMVIPRVISEVKSRDENIRNKNRRIEELIIDMGKTKKRCAILSQQNDKQLFQINDKDEKIFKLEADVVSCGVYISKMELIYKRIIKTQESGNWLERLSLKILGL